MLQKVESSSTFLQQNLYMLHVLPAPGKLDLHFAASDVIPVYGETPA